MAKTVDMPKMGYDMTEGKISRWIKNEGDAVNRGDALAEIETDKVTIEIEAFDSGVLRKIIRQVGETVPVGNPIAILGSADEAIDLAGLGSSPAPTASQAPAAATSAAAPAVAAPAPATPPPGGPLTLATSAAPAQRLTSPSQDHLKASPLARRLAEQHGVDLSQVSGSGPMGRIIRDDIEHHLRQAPVAAPAETPAPSAAPTPAPAPTSAPAEGEAIAVSRMRQTIARRTTESKQQVPHIYLTVEVMMDAAMALREQLNQAAADDGVKVSVNDLVVKAAAKALAKHRNVNASFAGDTIIQHATVDIGVAVTLENGLISPVLRNADQKAIGIISQETRELANRARTGTLRLEEYSGGTFTISNLGMYNIDEFDAIIVQPQAAILAVGAAAKRPVVRNDELAIATTMRLTLSADHRVVDGAPAALFLNEIRRLLENPMLLLI